MLQKRLGVLGSNVRKEQGTAPGLECLLSAGCLHQVKPVPSPGEFTLGEKNPSGAADPLSVSSPANLWGHSAIVHFTGEKVEGGRIHSPTYAASKWL